jgi:hypothetical protein
MRRKEKDGHSTGGRVNIVVGSMVLPTDVVSWSEKAVNLTLPHLELSAPVHAKFVVRRANGSLAIETPFQFCDLAR